jgi:hypothetical protein
MSTVWETILAERYVAEVSRHSLPICTISANVYRHKVTCEKNQRMGVLEAGPAFTRKMTRNKHSMP